jgi:hypothetical protein
MELMPYYDPNGVAPGEDLHYQDVGLNNCSSIWIDDSNGGYQGGGGSWYSPPSTGGSGTPSYPNNLGWGAVDANGFLLSRLVELQGILDIDPFAITPCDSANIMPLDDVTGYGAMYKRVAQFQIPGNVRSRIDSVNNVAPTSWLDDFYVQEIWKASGSVVNCDYFPIRIKQLPAGMQAGDLTEYFRLHINQFIDASIGVQFLPYTDGNFNDVAKFNSPFEQSVGSIIHLKLPFNDGTIVESDYYKDFTPGREIHRFQVSTVTSPLDHNHPVSGNRVFGVYSDQNRPGEFVFYIMGVDRTSDWKFALLNVRSTGFDMSDKLWQNVQQNMISYINSLPGGNAVYYTPAQVVARPHWDDVKNYLMGYITFEQLKTKLGC